MKQITSLFVVVKNEFILNLLTRFKEKTYLNKFCFRDYSPKACSDANIFSGNLYSRTV